MAPERGPDVDDLHDTVTETSPSDLKLNGQTPTTSEPVPAAEGSTDTFAIPPHLSHDPATNAKRTDPFQFGQRYLSEQDDVFSFNAWDHVTPDDEHLEFAEEQYAKQRATPVSDYDYKRFNDSPEKWWDLFYKQKSASFFKDRKWLVQEFPVLADVTKADAGPKVVLEVGAGAGNTAFPVMRINENPDLKLWAADFSKRAVKTMREADDYAAIAEGSEGRQGQMRAEVWDVASKDPPAGIDEGMVDVVIMIFIFSALNPRQWSQAVRNIWRLLKPGGKVLFRDYGRGDLAQVRFKTGRWMEENFYVRGDGTRVYFFDKVELEDIWTGKYWNREPGDRNETAREDIDHDSQDVPNVESLSDDPIAKPSSSCDATSATQLSLPAFKILDLDVDRRLIVNRQRRIKMYRCWMQGRFEKPSN